MRLTFLVVLIFSSFAINSLAQDSGLFAVPLNHVDDEGRPNLMRIIFDEAYFAAGLEAHAGDSVRKFQTKMVESKMLMTSITLNGQEGKGEVATAKDPAELHEILTEEINASLGAGFAKEARIFCYRNYVQEESLDSLLQLEKVADFLELDQMELSRLKKSQEALAQVNSEIHQVLRVAFLEIANHLGSKQKEIFLEKLEVDAPVQEVQSWVLHALVRKCKPQYQYFLASRFSKLDSNVFDYTIFLKTKRALEYLELVEKQHQELKSVQKAWLEQKTDPETKNKDLQRILLPPQIKLLNDFAWREIYFRGDLVKFFSNSFIQKELELNKDRATKLVKLVEEISNAASKNRLRLIKNHHQSLLSAMDNSSTNKLMEILEVEGTSKN